MHTFYRLGMIPMLVRNTEPRSQENTVCIYTCNRKNVPLTTSNNFTKNFRMTSNNFKKRFSGAGRMPPTLLPLLQRSRRNS
jgi:hypothetical protein